jgi:hypothetical protein
MRKEISFHEGSVFQTNNPGLARFISSGTMPMIRISTSDPELHP